MGKKGADCRSQVRLSFEDDGHSRARPSERTFRSASLGKLRQYHSSAVVTVVLEGSAWSEEESAAT